MPTYLPERIRVPEGDDAYNLTHDLRRMMESATTIVPVANQADRAALIAALEVAGRGPTPANPVYVSRADTGPGLNTEVTTDGLAWRTMRADDTGALAVASSNGFTTTGTARARQGWASMYGHFNPTADGGITRVFKNLGQLPPLTRPPAPMLIPMYSNLEVSVQGRILADGTIQAILVTGTRPISTTTIFSIAGQAWPV